MRKRELADLLERVHGWPKQKQEAAFDCLCAIEDEHPFAHDIDEERMQAARPHSKPSTNARDNRPGG